MLTVVERVLMLARGALADAPTSSLARLAAAAEEVELDPGEALWEPGAVADGLHIILDGEVTISGGPAGAVTQRRRAGELVDPAGAVRGDRRDQRATCAASAVVLRVPRDDLWRILGDEAELTRTLLSAIVAREEV